MDEMDIVIAQRIVLGAIRIVFVMNDMDLDFSLHENLDRTLHDIGIVSSEHRQILRSAVFQKAREEGYEIEVSRIPIGPTETVFNVVSALPGHSTKGNTL